MNFAAKAAGEFLPRILERKRGEVAEKKQKLSLAEVKKQAAQAAPARDFLAGLRDLSRPGHAIIAEVKKASPSKGLIRPEFDPVAIAGTYAANGARAVSVLTDAPFFQGGIEHLRSIRAAVALPLLCKDFILDEYQVFEARAAGADAALLIVAALPDSLLAELCGLIHELKMAALIEVHNEAELGRALKLKPNLLGINNRDLGTFRIDIETTLRLLPRVQDALVVSESGLERVEDLARLRRAGVHAFLIGEALMRAPDIGAKLRELVGARG
ncbi:MAG: hypothetical protein A2V67_07655 [Deltaproteobacteria bacterium RBG_13_61_14]|nr:MAG: hypothetical protein A2V67_07655 [Deltaproteobacteria bacterium RBG_13_61_14]